MASSIDNDHYRFKKIVKGKLRKNLKKFISDGKLIGKKGKDIVTIPVPKINIPKFVHGSNQKGVGQGQHGEGEIVGKPGPGEAGEEAGQHALEVDVTIEELADLLGEELELPNLKAVGKKDVVTSNKYNGISVVGPESLRHVKRTFKEALKRSMVMGLYDKDNPQIIPIKGDRRYRTYSPVTKPHVSAVVVLVMDCSGSMGRLQKDIARTTAFWIETWIKKFYKNVEVAYILHEVAAKQVDENTFYNLSEGGGTKISSGYKKAVEVINSQYPPSDWNSYVFHFSDGDNFFGDSEEAIKILRDEICPITNLFSYCQTPSNWGDSEFFRHVYNLQLENDNVSTTNIEDMDNILTGIKEIFGGDSE